MVQASKQIQAGGQIVETLAAAYAQLVDPRYLTYCALTSEVSRRVLSHFGLPAQVAACQLVASTPGGTYTVGYMGDTRPGKWDGHAVCLAGEWLIDGALTHVSRGLGLALPVCVAARRAARGSDILAALEFRGPEFKGPGLKDPGLKNWPAALRWREPPPGRATLIPSEPEAIINAIAAPLIQHVAAKLNSAK
jgi:hypothetical protein